jgi:hypothetical protein
VQNTIRELMLTAALVLGVTVLCLVALGFGVAGLHLLLTAHLPAWAAALLTAASLLVLALGLALLARTPRERPPARARVRDRERDRERGENETAGASTHAEALELALELAGASRLNAREATLLALVAGTVVGASPELRRTLLALIAPPAEGGGERSD